MIISNQNTSVIFFRMQQQKNRITKTFFRYASLFFYFVSFECEAKANQSNEMQPSTINITLEAKPIAIQLQT